MFLLSYLVEDCNDEVLEVLDVAKSPQEDVETPFRVPCVGDCSEPPEEEEPISESHDDVKTAASEFPDDAIEEDLEEEDAKGARAKL